MKYSKFVSIIISLVSFANITFTQAKPVSPQKTITWLDRENIKLDSLSLQELSAIHNTNERGIKFDTDFQFYKMDKKQEDKLLNNLSKEIAAELKEIKQHNSKKYFQLLFESQFKNAKYPFLNKQEKQLREQESNIFNKEIKTEYLVIKYKNAPSSKKKKLKKELQNNLSTLFELKEKRKRLQVEKLRLELDELQKSLEIRKKNKLKIIERRLQKLLGKEKYFEWN